MLVVILKLVENLVELLDICSNEFDELMTKSEDEKIIIMPIAY